MKFTCKGLSAASALAAALGLSLLGPHRAYAAPEPISVPGDTDLAVAILTPIPSAVFQGAKPVEISAFYQGAPNNQIISVDLYLDGVKAATKTLDVPETRGVVSFLVDSAQLTQGTHRIVIRATAADQEIKSAPGSFTFGSLNSNTEGMMSSPQNAMTPALSGNTTPVLHLINPTDDGRVQGTVRVQVEASDPSGKAPYVSLFIDHAFKTLKNYAPYEFEWDTTTYPNGYHTLEAFGYNETANVGHARSMRLYVNNPGGETRIRTDLKDAAPAPAPKRVAARPAPKQKSVGRPFPLHRPDAQLIASATETQSRHDSDALRRMALAGNPLAHLSSAKFAPELSSPFILETPKSVHPVTAPLPAALAVRSAVPVRATLPAMPAAKIAAVKFVSPEAIAQAFARTASRSPLRSFKPMPSVSRPSTPALLAEIQRNPRISAKAPRLMSIASIRLPENDLASPFQNAAEISTPVVKVSVPVVKIASYRAEYRAMVPTLPVMRAPRLKLHFATSGFSSLLRSVGQTSVMFNRATVKFDRPLAERQSVLFGPLRQIFEQGGGTLVWQPRTSTVRAKNATKNILLTIGSPSATVNARLVTLDGTPYLAAGRTMVPISFVALAMDANVQYDAVTGHLMITSKH